MTWANQFIGGAWSDDFNCYDWFRFMQREVFGRDVPVVPLSATGKQIKAGLSNWMRVSAAINDGDAVIMTDSNRQFHIGIYCASGDGLIVHAARRFGVVADNNFTLLVHGFKVRRFYTHTGGC